MTKKEIVNRNIGLTFDYIREVIKNPSFVEELPSNCEIEFVEKDFPIKDETTLNNKYIIKVKVLLSRWVTLLKRKPNTQKEISWFNTLHPTLEEVWIIEPHYRLCFL